jgi:sugar/nucleoside kinase (ribokinase family)
VYNGMGRKVVLISSFTIDRIEIGGSVYEKIGGPAYYAGITLALMGMEPILITSTRPDMLERVKEIFKDFPRLRLINTKPSCSSIYVFRHIYDSYGRRYSEILDVGCPIELESIDGSGLEFLLSSSWILISPVYREIEPEDVERLTSLGRVAIDLQGFSREIDNRKVISSLKNILKSLQRIPRVSLIHLSSDDIRDIASESIDDLRKIRSIIEKALATAYTIGSRGGYIHIGDRPYEEIKVEMKKDSEPVWYYIPSYIEMDTGDPTGCGDIFISSLVGSIAMGYNILDAAIRASAISGIRVSRGFPVEINFGEIENISKNLEKKVQRIQIL